MKHALAVLAGLAVGLPGMAALASMDRHTASALPERFVPWARARSFAQIRNSATRHETRSSPPPPGTPSRSATTGLHVSIQAPHTVRPGGTYTYRVRLANRGPDTPGEITVHNLLPSGVERTGTSLPGGAGGYAGSRDTTVVMPRLGPGKSATARFVVRVRPRAHGELVARSRIASIDGARVPRSGVAKASTRIR